jgi:hypothetical protein
MMAAARTIWQISGGPASRTYAETFLTYGVGLIGPGWLGAWNRERHLDHPDASYVRQIADELKQGDVFLLRLGRSRVCAVGVVGSDYQFFEQFDDVNGWDLQHGRRVHWFRLPVEYDFVSPVFGANPARISRVNQSVVVDYATRFLNSPPTHWQTAPLPALPSADETLELDRLSPQIQDVVATVQDLARSYWGRGNFPDHPSEDELIVHCVVPLLRALGWQPELIGIKWRYGDVVLFKSLPRNTENCHLIIEVKRLGAGVEGAMPQARGYADAWGIARDLVVTDGVRYRLYDCKTGHQAVAYANLASLKVKAFQLFDRLEKPR